MFNLKQRSNQDSMSLALSYLAAIWSVFFGTMLSINQIAPFLSPLQLFGRMSFLRSSFALNPNLFSLIFTAAFMLFVQLCYSRLLPEHQRLSRFGSPRALIPLFGIAALSGWFFTSTLQAFPWATPLVAMAYGGMVLSLLIHGLVRHGWPQMPVFGIQFLSTHFFLFLFVLFSSNLLYFHIPSPHLIILTLFCLLAQIQMAYSFQLFYEKRINALQLTGLLFEQGYTFFIMSLELLIQSQKRKRENR